MEKVEKIKEIKEILSNPYSIIPPLARRDFFNWLSDKAYLKLLFRVEWAKKLN